MQNQINSIEVSPRSLRNIEILSQHGVKCDMHGTTIKEKLLHLVKDFFSSFFYGGKQNKKYFFHLH